MRHVTRERVMSHMNESCHKSCHKPLFLYSRCAEKVVREQVISHSSFTNESCHKSYHKSSLSLSLSLSLFLSLSSCHKKSLALSLSLSLSLCRCPEKDRVLSQVIVSLGVRRKWFVNESCHKFVGERVMSQVMSHVMSHELSPDTWSRETIHI